MLQREEWQALLISDSAGPLLSQSNIPYVYLYIQVCSKMLKYYYTLRELITLA